ncbi:MAG TPA: M20 family metallopeptidase [Desulfobacterales bacterium]
MTPMTDIRQLLEELIRFKSTHSNTEEIHRCADYIAGCLQRWGIEHRRLNFQDVPSILVTPAGETCPVLLMSHIDVVEGGEAQFEPRLEGNRLYGRGSIDDKYAVAMSMLLFRQYLQRLGRQSAVPFGLLITGDEEIGGANGAKKVLPLVKARFCIALDGGQPEKIVVKEKGILHLKLISSGRSAHAARPWLGENAIERLFADFAKIRTFFEEDVPDHWHRTINFSRVSGGKSINQVPDTAEATFDIRYTENDDIEALVQSIQSAIQGRLVIEKKEPVFLGGDSPYLDRLLEVAAGTRTGFEHGASDARHLFEYGIKGIVWGADGGMSQHTENEFVDLQTVETIFELLTRYFDHLPDSDAA